ncbi:DUF2927 domain-containing protein [uncultured Tateyamaria sp.]|uniref:DUF2927 domain-containing protein n=1 Tax=Tateyamaria sp. 1078 TaxID=3417464 RepID=UPI00261D77DE|nr:DUF2927 domain-containing protein [uncultured Tateyamaria sp.]
MIRRPRLWKALGGVAALVFLAACDMPPVTTDPVLTPRARPDPAAVAPPPPVRATSERSAALRSYLGAVQSSQLTQGLLRQDGGGPDTPFTATMLARNFEQIAFFDEFTPTGEPGGGEAVLRRWDMPVRIAVAFGASVPPSQRTRDTANTRSYARRLARATGHPIAIAPNPNFYVIFASEDDRGDVLDEVAARLGNPLTQLRSLSRDTYCAVVAFGGGTGRATTTAAVAVVRAENPDLLRLSCIHEEIAQGLGLPNDSPAARPSIFNDDDEFALLTDHDEALLGMLYDARLTTGMDRAEARPIVRQLAAERTGEALTN